MEVKDIGVKKNRGLIPFLLILVSVAFLLTCVFMWWDYASQDHYKYLSENVIEIEATVTYYKLGTYGSSDPLKKHYAYFTICEYKSEWGTVYRKTEGRYYKESDAKAQIGKKVKLYIDPNSDWSGKYFPIFDYERALKNAIIWCFPVPFALYLIIYRCIYRSVINRKIKKTVYGKYYNNDKFIHTPQPNTVTKGEVTKVRKWLVCYVKVKYQDENGVEREKWARSWFTHKDAKFLQQKKIINIVPYKNTYGILEEFAVNDK